MIKNKRIKIAFIFHDSDRYSGATRSLLDIIDKIIVNGLIDIVAIFPTNSGTAIEYLRDKEVNIIVSYYSQARVAMNENKIRYLIALPIRLMRQIIGLLYTKFQLVPKLKEMGVSGIYTNTSTILVGAYLKKYIKLKYIWHFREFGEEDQSKKMLFGRRHFYKLANKYADEVIVLSKAMYEKYAEYIYETEVNVVYNDISPNHINKKNKFSSNSNSTLNILIAGQIKPEKGQKQAIEALERLVKEGCNIKLFIAGVGSNDYILKLKEYTERKKIEDYVEFLGHVSDLTSLRTNMDIGVVPSKFEAFGRVTIEGMLSCMTMIGSNKGGTLELIEDEKTGLIYEWGNIQDLTRKILYLYNNREHCVKLANNGFEFAMNFTKGSCAEHIQNSFLKYVKE
ncbi:MAG: glycosyltransferase family 4 protein [Eubacteriales bacterium]